MTKLQLQDNKTIQPKEVNTITRINVERIPCYTSIGIDEGEKELGQRLFIDVYVDVDSSRLKNTDDINDTFSYVDIYKVVQEIGKKPHSLIEALGEEIAMVILKHPLVTYTKIRVHKPHIPYEEFQGNVSVEVERKNDRGSLRGT